MKEIRSSRGATAPAVAAPGPLFDRDRSLHELLHDLPMPQIGAAIEQLCGPYVLVDGAGSVHTRRGVIAIEYAEIPIRWQAEPVGFLRASVSVQPTALRSAADLLEAIIASAARYAMARDLHSEAVAADFDALQREHAQLAASEARYRDLAASLERRVADQVKALDNGYRQVYRSEKLASVGRLAAGVAHEINNPIGFVRSNLATARGYVEKFGLVGAALREGRAGEAESRWRESDLDYILEDFSALIEESIAGADRIAAIVGDLRRAANIDRAEEALADVNELVRAAVALASNGAAAHPRLALQLRSVPPIRCRPAQISELIRNLLSNSIAAIQSGGEVTVRTEMADSCLVLEVIDTGEGIAPETLPRVFDPFFTTRAVGQGTGLGLTVCRDIVEAHEGTIDLASAPGRGTTVTVRIPAGSSGGS